MLCIQNNSTKKFKNCIKINNNLIKLSCQTILNFKIKVFQREKKNHTGRIWDTGGRSYEGIDNIDFLSLCRTKQKTNEHEQGL